MKITEQQEQTGWGRTGRVAIVAFGCVLALVAGTAVAASANSGNAKSGDRSVLALEKRISDLEYTQTIQEAKLEITEQQSRYGLLFNGDGPNGPDRAAWGEQIFTGDGPFLAYDSNLQLIPSQSFDHMKDEIAAAIATQPTTWPDPTRPNGSMHYMFAPVFKSISPTDAVTDTPSVSLSGVKGTAAPVSITIRVYHDVWKHTKDGWRKTTSTWYRLD
jgi:hypothetical protein